MGMLLKMCRRQYVTFGVAVSSAHDVDRRGNKNCSLRFSQIKYSSYTFPETHQGDTFILQSPGTCILLAPWFPLWQWFPNSDTRRFSRGWNFVILCTTRVQALHKRCWLQGREFMKPSLYTSLSKTRLSSERYTVHHICLPALFKWPVYVHHSKSISLCDSSIDPLFCQEHTCVMLSKKSNAQFGFCHRFPHVE